MELDRWKKPVGIILLFHADDSEGPKGNDKEPSSQLLISSGVPADDVRLF